MTPPQPTDELRECPFCGSSEDVIIMSVGESEKVFYVHCIICQAEGPLGDTESEARRLWNERMGAVKRISELAFEDFTDDSQPTLWRVSSTRPWKERPIRHTNWFCTEDAARKHAAWIASNGGTVRSVSEYKLVDSGATP